MTKRGVRRFGTSAGSLLAEFVVIVVGVLFALGVDQFITQREDAGRAFLYLEAC